MGRHVAVLPRPYTDRGYAPWVRFLPVVLASLACSSSPNHPGEPVPASRPRIVAHRGASHDAPENTLAAFRRAWELGVEGIELDVHVSRDGHVVVIHDETTARVAGVDRPVAQQTLAELQALDVGSWKSNAFASERIPTLAEVFETVPGGRTVFVEIKSDVATVPAVARAIRGAPASIAIALQGYDPATLAALAAEVPGAPAYWTVDPIGGGDAPYPEGLLGAAKQYGFVGVALDHRAVSRPFVGATRESGLALDVWTINEAELLAAWMEIDSVRWIETDHPDRAPVR